MVLPKNCFCRKAVLAKHRANKGVDAIAPGEYLDWRRRVALADLPKPQADPKKQAQTKAKAKAKAAESSSSTKSKVTSKTSVKAMHTKD